MVRDLMDGKTFVLLCLANFNDMVTVRVVLKIFFQDRDQVLLFIISDDDIDRQVSL